MAMAGSLVSNASILLMSVAILANEVIDDFIDKSPPLKAMDCEFLGFSRAWLPLDEFFG